MPTSRNISSFSAAAAARDHDVITQHCYDLLHMTTEEPIDTMTMIVLTRGYRGQISRIRAGTRLNGLFASSAEATYPYAPEYPGEHVFERLHANYEDGQRDIGDLGVRSRTTLLRLGGQDPVHVREYQFGRSAIGQIECREYWRLGSGGTNEFLCGELMRRVTAPADSPIKWLYLCAQVGPLEPDVDIDAVGRAHPWPTSVAQVVSI